LGESVGTKHTFKPF